MSAVWGKNHTRTILKKKQAVFCFEKSKTLEYSDFCFLAKTNWKFHAVPLMNGEDNKTVIPSKNST
jgi:hypothetical protein